MNKKSVLENLNKVIDKTKRLTNLNIFINNTFESALKQTNQRFDKKTFSCNKDDRLNGKIMTIKDNFCTKGVATTCGSRMLASYVPPYNATIVEKLLNSGTIMLGKTNMDEFGMGSSSTSFTGSVKNPWNMKLNSSICDFNNDSNSNDWYISGGSSGGSAASVSANIADFSIGSDTGGSIRNPASICGCIGFKPTYGLVSRFGLIPLNNYFDTVGILAKTIQTTVDVLNCIAGSDKKDATTIKSEYKHILLNCNFKISNVTIGIPKEFYPEGLVDCNLNAWEKAIKLLATKGNATIKEISLKHVPYSMSCYSVLTSCEIFSNFARYDGLRYGLREYNIKENKEKKFNDLLKRTRDMGFGPVVKGRILSGNYFLLKENYKKYFLKAQNIRSLIQNDFKKVFSSKIDIILTPTCFRETHTYTEYLKQEEVFDEKDFFTACANIAGVPAISLPSILSNKLMPVGIQFIANCGNDELLLNVANWFENNRNSNFEYLDL